MDPNRLASAQPGAAFLPLPREQADLPSGYPAISLARHNCGGSRAELAGLVGGELGGGRDRWGRGGAAFPASPPRGLHRAASLRRTRGAGARLHCGGRAELAGARGRRVSRQRLARSWRVAGAGEGRAPSVVSRGVGGGGHHGRCRAGSRGC
jgi:hypothetical protein